MTIIRTLPFAYSGTGALAPLQVTQFELDLAANPNTLSWWRADVGFVASWLDRKAGRALVPNRTGVPTIATPPGYNGQRALAFTTGSANGCLLVDNGIPVSADYSIALVGHAPHFTGNQTFLADDKTALRTAFVQHPTADRLNITHSGTTILASTTGPVLSVTTPNVIVWSYKKSTKVSKARLNGVEMATGRTDASEIDDGTLQLAMQGDAAGAQFPLIGGFVAELIVFDTALADPPNAALLASLEGYLKTRYAVA